MAMFKIFFSQGKSREAWKRVNEAAAQGRTLSDEDLRHIILHNMIWQSEHDKLCSIRYAILIALIGGVLFLKVYEQFPELIGLLS